MTEITKGKSPFYPGQPVPVELFVGRGSQIERIMTRGAGQVEQGKPIAMYIQGEYGIGKSSIAGYVQWLAERDHNLHSIYAPLSNCSNLNDVAEAVLNATIRSGAFYPTRTESIGNWLGKYITKQSLFGQTIDLSALKQDAPALSSPHEMLNFLRETRKRLENTGVKGIFLVLDALNGISSNPQFAHFIKSLIDSNALSPNPLPLLLILCGVEERRREMIQKHQPIDRIFDVVEIAPMNEMEMEEFFNRAFRSVHMEVDKPALKRLTFYSAGFPKIMHLLGDAVYWVDKDGIINNNDAKDAVLIAADEVGKKYVDQQVYRALRSSDYHSILLKISKVNPNEMGFMKSVVASALSATEKKKFNNFLQKMKRLKVIRSGDVKGEYIFNMRMVRLYIWLQSLEQEKSKN